MCCGLLHGATKPTSVVATRFPLDGAPRIAELQWFSLRQKALSLWTICVICRASLAVAKLSLQDIQILCLAMALVHSVTHLVTPQSLAAPVPLLV